MANFLVLLVLLAQFVHFSHCNAYCRHMWTTSSFYGDYNAAAVSPTQTHASVETINRNGHSSPTYLLITDYSVSSNGKTFISKPLKTGLFDPTQDEEISDSDFCTTTGKLHAADVDGDHFDDLLCQSTDGTFKVRYYYNGDYLTEVPYASDFRCPPTTNYKLLIGDFDGNHAEDLMCVDSLRTSADNTPIYFSRSCHDLVNHYQQNRYHWHMHHLESSILDSGKSVKSCRSNPGIIGYLSPGAFPNCDPSSDLLISLDANGDGTSDIACQTSLQDNNSNEQTFIYISFSQGAQAVFSRSPKVASGCPQSQDMIVAADTDGDGDDDLICLFHIASSGSNVNMVYSQNGHYGEFSFEPSFTCSNSLAICGASGLPSWFIGDFNQDGKDDVMCRQSDGTAINTLVLFSEVYP